MLRVGDQLRNYRIAAELRPGGMGTLFLAERVGTAGFTQHVAVKVIHPHLAAEEGFSDVLIHEALLGARISHPNVVRVEELGEEDGLIFMVMEYVHGASVAEVLSRLYKQDRAFSPEVSVAIAARAADGLHAAHETKTDDGALLNIVHRDISPQNILISSSGAVKLIDFGIAKALSTEPTTATGSLKGKIRYMSPEQAFGRELDRTTDIYSLGIVLWEMLVRRRMFKRGDNLAVLDSVRNPTIPAPHEIDRSIPEALSNVVMKALAKKPTERYATARAFRRELLAAIPNAHDVDGPRLADLVTTTMGASLASKVQSASAARPLAEEVSVVDGLSAASFKDAVPKQRRGWIAVIVLAFVSAVALFLSWPSKPAPTPLIVIEAPPPPSPAVEPPPPPPAAPPAVKPTPEKKVAKPVRRRPKPQRKKKPLKKGPKAVDGVPIFEEPSF